MRLKSKHLQVVLFVFFLALVVLVVIVLVGEAREHIINDDATSIVSTYDQGRGVIPKFEAFAKPGGSVYYTFDCDHGLEIGKQDLDKNFIFFISKQEAEARGFKKAKKCTIAQRGG